MLRINTSKRILIAVIAVACATVPFFIRKPAKPLAKPPKVEWTQILSSASRDDMKSLVVDKNCSLYAVGETGGLLFGKGTGHGCPFVAKFDTKGNLLWGKQFYEGNFYVTNSLVSPDGKIYITGDSMNSSSAFESRLITMSDDGNRITNVKILNTGMYIDSEPAVYASSNGTVYTTVRETGISGVESRILIYGPKPKQIWHSSETMTDMDANSKSVCICMHHNPMTSSTPSYPSDSCIIQTDLQGKELWRHQMTDKNAIACSVEFGNNGDVYVSGIVQILPKQLSIGSSWLDKFYRYISQKLYKMQFARSGEIDYFICKFSANGKLIWFKRPETPCNDMINDFAIDSKDNLYLSVNAAVAIDPTKSKIPPLSAVASSPAPKAFLVKFNSNGQLLWIKTLPEKESYINAIAIDHKDSVYIGGTKSQRISDAFVMKLESK